MVSEREGLQRFSEVFRGFQRGFRGFSEVFRGLLGEIQEFLIGFRQNEEIATDTDIDLPEITTVTDTDAGFMICLWN